MQLPIQLSWTTNLDHAELSFHYMGVMNAIDRERIEALPKVFYLVAIIIY